VTPAALTLTEDNKETAMAIDMGYSSGEFEMSGKIVNRQQRPQ
jgi:hypothetical protein